MATVGTHNEEKLLVLRQGQWEAQEKKHSKRGKGKQAINSKRKGRKLTKPWNRVPQYQVRVKKDYMHGGKRSTVCQERETINLCQARE